MLGRRNKKRTGSSGSVDLLANAPAPAPPQHHQPAPNPDNGSGAPSRAFNYLVERARGAVSFGTRERQRTNSDDGSSGASVHTRSQEHHAAPSSTTAPSTTATNATASSSSSKSLFGRSNESTGSKSNNHNNLSFPSSTSTQDLGARGAGGGGGAGGFFSKRTPTVSNPSRPGWLGSNNDKKTPTPSPLTSSPSSPILSSQQGSGGGGASSSNEPRRRDVGIVAESGKRLAEVSGSSNDATNALLSTSRKAFARSVEDVCNKRVSRIFLGDDVPPLPHLARRSTDELSHKYSQSQQTPSTLTTSSSTRRQRTTSLAPSAALDSYPSPNLSISAPSTHSSRSSSPRPPLPFPTSASTPNLAQVSPALSTTSDGERKRDSQTILYQGFLQRKGDYVPSSPNGSALPTSSSFASSTSPSTSSQSYFTSRGTTTSTSSPHLRATKSEVDLARGWKPYRAIVKGTKLYLHRLPTDLSSTAKHLFPTTILDVTTTSPPTVQPSPAASPVFSHSTPTLDGVGGGENGKRKQRAFWGTGGTPHPGLVVGEQRPKVRGGTLEALVHELVFATSFVKKKKIVGEEVKALVEKKEGEEDAVEPPPPSPPEEEDDEEELAAAYAAFVDTLLLFWPALPLSPAHSASELDRCAGLAVRTAVDASSKDPEGDGPKATSQALAERLTRIIKTICERHPQDLKKMEKGVSVPSDWKVALEEVAKQLATLVETTTVGELVETTFEEQEHRTIKSRPLTDWVPHPTGGGTSKSATSSNSGSPTKTRKRLPSDQDLSTQMTAQAFLQTDPLSFATQIHLFHLDRLAAISGNISTPRHILRTASLLLRTDPNLKQTAITSLFSFSPASPHFLTRVALQTILAQSSTMHPTALFSPSNATSPSDARALVIAHWIVVGEELRKKGDAAGWVAVAMALCGRAVARLEDSWRLVESEKVDVVREEWVPVLRGIGFADFEATEVKPLRFGGGEEDLAVPFLGSVLEETMVGLSLACAPGPDHQPGSVNLVPLYPLREKLDAVAVVWPQSSLEPSPATPDSKIQLFLQACSRLGLPEKPHLSAYLVASLEAEPRPWNQNLALHFKQRSPTEPSPLLPLLMVEPLPHITLVDRDKIISTNSGLMPRKQSASGPSGGGGPTQGSSSGSSSNTSPTATPGRLARHNSYPPSATPAIEQSGVFTRLRKEIATPSDTLLRFADGDIVFRIISAALPVVPVSSPNSNERGMLSRTSSWVESRSSRIPNKSARVSLSSSLAPLSRASSRRESSPGGGSVQLQVASEEEPVHVVVKSGTVETLVDLLVLGISNLRTPSIDADGQSSLTDRRPLALDLDDYRSAFFATFRSFTSPLIIFDMLRKRYLAAPNASKDFVNLSAARPFPTWSTAPPPPATSTTEVDEWDWDQIASIRLGVLRNLRYWLEHHVGDFLDDDELFSSMSTFLAFVESTETEAIKERPDDDAVLAEVQRLLKRFGNETLRPAVKLRMATSKTTSEETDVSALSYDGLDVSELVARLDQVACCVTKDLTELDLLRYIDTLESQVLADPAAWYSSRALSKTDDEELLIADSYSIAQLLSSDASLLRQTPQSLQYAYKAHSVVRRWILAHLVDPDIALQKRQQRMLKAIEMIEHCRSRMSNVFFGGQAERQSSMLDPSLASFVERAITSAIVAPECRLFASAWQGVATARNVSTPDSLISLVKSTLLVTDSTVTLDLGWLNERLVEIATHVDSLSEGVSINFSKRRWIFNTIRNALAIHPAQRDSSNAVLVQMEKRLTGWGSWSLRVLRDVAYGEGYKTSKSVKPFSRLVAQQQEKVRRDKTTRDLVTKGQKLEQQGRLQREKEVAKAMDKSISVRTRRMTSLFRVSRPLSTAVTSPPLPALPTSPSLHALQSLQDWVPTSKPYLVLTLSGVEVQPYDNTQRSFVFEMATEDGQCSLFQATNVDEFNSWLNHFRRSGTQIAFRRATFLAQTPLAEEAEEVVVKPIAPAPTHIASTGFFAVPLGEIVAREGIPIPRFVEKALELIEERGLTEVGIYRISGENRVIHQIKDALNRGGDPVTLLDTDVHNITGLFKLFLRELPEPVIPFDLYNDFISADAIDGYDERLYMIRDLIWSLPAPNFALLRRLTQHCDMITDNEEVNAMHAANLAIIFAPTLFKPPGGQFGLLMTNLPKAVSLVKSFILQTNWIFSEEGPAEEDEVVEDEPVVAQVEEPEVATEVTPVGLGLSTSALRLGAIDAAGDDTPTPISAASDRAVVNFAEEQQQELPPVVPVVTTEPIVASISTDSLSEKELPRPPSAEALASDADPVAQPSDTAGPSSTTEPIPIPIPIDDDKKEELSTSRHEAGEDGFSPESVDTPATWFEAPSSARNSRASIGSFSLSLLPAPATGGSFLDAVNEASSSVGGMSKEE